jgi:hypothetical protein
MGGFHCFTGSDKAKESYKPEHPLPWGDVISLLEAKTIGLPSEGEIQDKSKTDWIAKTFVLLQTLWFVTQCIARHIEHLPTTELEIVTLAYTTINFGIFLAWLDKPQNVECPIRVFQQPQNGMNDGDMQWFNKAVHLIVGTQDQRVDICGRRKVPVFYSGGPRWKQLSAAGAVALMASIVFGAIHCIAWSFHFATPIEALLWRLSAVSITAIPALLMVAGEVAIRQLGTIPGIQRRELSRSRRRGEALQLLLGKVWTFASLPLILLYIIARIITVVLAFINLSSLPPGAFETVHWTTLIPHL